MSRKNIILLVLFLILVSVSVGFYLFVKNKELQNTYQNVEETKQVEMLNELKVLRADSFVDGKEELKKLNLLKSLNTNTTNTTSPVNNKETTSTPEVKQKSPTELLEELKGLRSSTTKP